MATQARTNDNESERMWETQADALHLLLREAQSRPECRAPRNDEYWARVRHTIDRQLHWTIEAEAQALMMLLVEAESCCAARADRDDEYWERVRRAICSTRAMRHRSVRSQS